MGRQRRRNISIELKHVYFVMARDGIQRQRQITELIQEASMAVPASKE